MYRVSPARQRNVLLFPTTVTASLKLLLIALVFASVPLALYVRVDSKDAKPAVTVHAAGRGKQFFNFTDGRAMHVGYRGDQNLTAALQGGQAQPRSLGSIVLAADAVPDLIAGYAYAGMGIVTVQHGNPDAFAPRDESVYVRMQQGYNPEPLLPAVDTYLVPESPDFLQLGDFNHDNRKDVLVGTRGGHMFLLAGDGQGRLDVAEQIALPGVVTTLAAGEFRAADGQSDVAVGVNGPNGAELLIYDGAEGVLTGTPMHVSLRTEASAVQFAGMDSDSFTDAVVAAGNEIDIIHGWGRKATLALDSRVERVNAPSDVRGMALGHFIWDREGIQQIATLASDGTVSIVEPDGLDTRPYTDDEILARRDLRTHVTARNVDVESTSAWQPSDAKTWVVSRQISTGALSGGAVPQAPLTRTNIASRETEDLVITGSTQTLNVVRQIDRGNADSKNASQAISTTGDMANVSLSSAEEPVAVLQLPTKLNGERNLVVLQANSSAPIIIPNAPTSITVDRFDDVGIQAACTGAASDCNLRGAVQFANTPANSPATINLPAGTYTLTTNGGGGGGCDGNSIGDLGINLSTNITGAGSASTIILQNGSSAATNQDRVMCLNEPFALNIAYSFSGITISGGRDNTTFGAAAIVAGEKGNALTLTNVVISNNQSTGANVGGGAVQILGGDLTLNSCTIGGTAAPGAFGARSNSAADLAKGNTNSTSSGAGIGFDPSAPTHDASTGVFTSTGTTFGRNVAANSGGGITLFTSSFSGHTAGTGSASFATSTFSNNSAGNGGGIENESFNATVATTSFTSNAATGAGPSSGHGGGIHVGGGTGFTLNGTNPTITFSGNTATVGGSSVSTNGLLNVSGTNTTIGGSVEVETNGTWTNDAGSTLNPTDILVLGGTFTCNNSTMNMSGNLTIGHETTKGAIFNANTGTINIQGNLSVDLNNGGSGAVGQFNAGTGLFNFNGTLAQSITNVSAITFNNLTDSNVTQPLTANNSFGVGGTLTVNGANAIFDPVAAAVISGGGTLTGTGTARVRSLAGFSSQYTITNKTLTNLTVEYIGAGAQTGSAITYGPLKINNTNGVNLAAGTMTVGGLLTLQTGALGVGTQTLFINDGTTVVGGSITSSPTGTVTYNQLSAGQNVRAFNYGNLTFSAFTKVLAATGTIGVAGTFNPNGITTGHTITGSTFDFNGPGAQSIPAFNFNNLTITGVRTINTSVTLVNGATIGIAGNFVPSATFSGTGGYIVTNNTVDFNGTGAQSIGAPFNFNNLTISGNHGGAAITLGAGTIGIASTFSPTATNNTYVTTGNTVNFNGSALQSIPAFTFGGLTLTNAAGGANLSGNVTVNAALLLAAGQLGVGTNTLTLNGAASFGVGTLTSSPTGTVIYNQQSNGQATVLAADYGNLTFSNFSKTLASSGTIGIAGIFTPGTGTGHTITGSTINFNAAGPQTIPGFTYNNLTSTGAFARTLDPVNTIKIAGVFTPGASTYTITGSTVEYNGAAAQTLPSSFTTYNNLTLNNPTTTLGFAGLTVQGLLRVQAGTFTSSSTYNNVQIDVGATLAGTNATTINLSGNFANSGTFNGNGNTVNLNGTGAQTIGGTGASNFSNLTNANTGANNVTLGGNISVANVLGLGANNINTSTFTLTQPGTGTSSGTGDVIGNVKRTVLVAGTTYSFGNPLNTIKVEGAPVPADINMNLVKAPPAGFAQAINRTYTITPNGANGLVTLRLHYLDSELNGNVTSPPPGLLFRRFNGTTGWTPVTPTSSVTNSDPLNYLEKTGQPTLSPWTMSSVGVPTATSGTISGRIADSSGVAVEGAVVNLSGTQNRKTITDASGNYSFANVETTGFYTVRATRANYSFSPQERSFSQLGNQTEAAFTATAQAVTSNPLDTAEYFVRQHYLDFLGREPEESGFNFWSDQILGCGSDAACAEVKRINVSAAYFLSIEFQTTGGLVDGVYRASFDRAPQYGEFLPDQVAVAKDVVVGRSGWEQQLSTNRQAFLDAFVQRSAFQNVYGGLSNSQYVDTLLTNTRIIWSQSERDALVNGLASGSVSRAGVLGQIAGDQRFVQAKFNKTFVMMEYFGYLRRDPDAEGYQYWLNKLNQFNGNFEQAEMVKAFIVSGEYRGRFPR